MITRELLQGLLNDLEPYSYEGDERPTDLMDCGYIDGQIDLLESLLEEVDK